MEAAGGRCLPCIVDIRDEDQVQAAVDKAVETFGGIDILVNNASAIQLSGTSATSMKRSERERERERIIDLVGCGRHIGNVL